MRAKIKLCFGTELQKGLGTFLEPTGSIVFQVDTHNGIKYFSFLLFVCFYFHEILLSILYCLNRNAFVVQLGSVLTFEIAMLWVQFLAQQIYGYFCTSLIVVM